MNLFSVLCYVMLCHVMCEEKIKSVKKKPKIYYLIIKKVEGGKNLRHSEMFYLFKVRYLNSFGGFKGCVNKFQNLAKKHNISRRVFTKIHNK